LDRFDLLQEIYPPKIGEFAYVTDGACTEADIQKQELVMLKVCAPTHDHVMRETECGVRAYATTELCTM